jgi:glucokinase
MVLHPHDSLISSEQQPHPSQREGYVAGVDIGGTNLRLALSDLEGRILGRWSTSTIGIRDPDLIVRLICEGIEVLLLQQSASRERLHAIAAGAPGVTNADAGIVIATSYLMGWQDVPLRDLLEAALGVPAFIDNDVNMAAFGELHAGAAQGVNNFVFIALGTGVGAGIVLNRKLFYGDGWIAGEIGYMLVPGTSEAPVEHGKPGALEKIAGGEGIQSQWQSRWSEELSTLPQNATATQIFDHALEGNELAQEVLHVASKTLAYAIYNIALVLNCPLFVLGGSVGLHPVLGDATRKLLKARDAGVQPRIVASILGAEAQLTGAIFRAIETAKAFTDSASNG